MALKNSFKIFEIEKKPRKGLLAVEWIIIGYMVLTMLLAFFMTTKIHHIEPMIWGRFRMVMMMLGLWLVYRLIPCVHDVLPHPPTVTRSGIVVPRNFRVQSSLPQPRSALCGIRTAALQLPTRPTLLASHLAPRVQRTDASGLLLVFPAHRHRHAVLLLQAV